MPKGRKPGTKQDDAQLSELLSRIEAMDATLSLAESRLDELERQRATLQSRLAASEQELEASRAECASLEQSSDGAALAVVRLEARIEQLEHELIQARRELIDYAPGIAEEAIGADGGTLEHSPGRQLTLVNRLAELAEREELHAAVEARKVATEECLAWMVAPSGRVAQLGDADPDVVPSTHVEPRLALVNPGGRGRGKRPALTMCAMPESGWFAVRAPVPGAAQPPSFSYLLQICGRHSDRYKHDDDFSFVWFEGSRAILADAGRGGDGEQRRYVRSTRAHNVATIDESAEAAAEPEPFGSGLKHHGEGRQLFFSECERRLGDVSHARVLAFRPASWVAVIDIFHDPTGAEHEYGQRFLFGCELEAAPSGAGVSASLDDHTSLHAIPFFEAPLAGVWRGQREPALEGWCSADGELVPSTAVKFARAGGREVMATVLWLGEEQPQVESELSRTNVSGRRIRLGWIGDGARHQVDVVREDGLEVRYRAPSL